MVSPWISSKWVSQYENDVQNTFRDVTIMVSWEGDKMKGNRSSGSENVC